MISEASSPEDVGAVGEFPIGEGRRVLVGEHAIAVFRRSDDTFCAVTDRCPHAAAPLSAGTLRDGAIVCAWHGWCFDPATGRSTNVPWAEPVALHDVEARSGRVLVTLRLPTGG